MAHQKIIYSFLILSFLIISCVEKDQQSIIKLSPDEFEKKIKSEKITLLDVRSEQEFRSGHLTGSTNYDISNGTLNAKIKDLDKSKPIMVYCAVGGRSGAASKLLAENGFTKIYDLEGGIRSWEKAGKEVVK